MKIFLCFFLHKHSIGYISVLYILCPSLFAAVFNDIVKKRIHKKEPQIHTAKQLPRRVNNGILRRPNYKSKVDQKINNLLLKNK